MLDGDVITDEEGFKVAVCPTGPDALAAFDRDGRTWCYSTSGSLDHHPTPSCAGACASAQMCR
jgi:hypothetical protein